MWEKKFRDYPVLVAMGLLLWAETSPALCQTWAISRWLQKGPATDRAEPWAMLSMPLGEQI